MQRIEYKNLGNRAKENYNFAKVASRLADYGYSCIRLTDDWDGADFIAVHIDGSMQKVQLKSRLTFNKKYRRKELWMAFRDGDDIYFFPHDKLLAKFLRVGAIGPGGEAWHEHGWWAWPRVPKKYLHNLAKYKLSRPQ